MFDTKKCPRCSEKMPKNALKCSYCGLIFERLKWATNKAGKKMLKKKEKDKVVMVTDFPSDISRYKLLLIAIFLGIFGGHCYYVGRIKRGIYMTISGIVFVVGLVLSINSMIPESINSLVQILVGILGFMWIFDVFNICIKKFKVPVSIDYWEEK